MQQFTIQSEKIRDKLNNLLPSQNVGGIGVELTGSTQVIPIVDLTEIAEGSNLRQDLQTSLSLISCTAFNVNNTTTTVINTTGYFRVFGVAYFLGTGNINFRLTDGTTTKLFKGYGASSTTPNNNFDFNVFLQAGDSMTIEASSGAANCIGNTRQLADLSGNLVNPQ